MAKAAKAYKIEKKRNGKYAVKARGGKYLQGLAKAEVLFKEKLIKDKPSRKAFGVAEEVAPETSGEEASAES